MRCFVAIPVRNEAQTIKACLDALGLAIHCCRHDVHVVLLLNGCTDGTRKKAMQWMASSGIVIDVREAALPPALDHAGGARAAALRAALHHSGTKAGDIVLTTDADSRVPPDWISRAVDGLQQGCDVIAGDFDIDPATMQAWPDSLRRRVDLEDAYARLLDEADAHCDPLPHNPWPAHRRCSGASLAFRAEALLALDELPAPPCGEDHALVAACLARDLRVRHDPFFRVVTSGRLIGRADGGMAGTLGDCQRHGDRPCDALLEDFSVHVARALLRARARRVFRAGMTTHALADALGVRAPFDPSVCVCFGQAWQRLEQGSPDLARTPLHPGALRGQIGEARAWLDAFTPEGVAA